jgi:signal transduction histidine kinase/ActR/RegA family two-component response regulator
MKGDILNTSGDNSNPKDCHVDPLDLVNKSPDRRQTSHIKGRRSIDIGAGETEDKITNREKLIIAREDHAHLREILTASREQLVSETETSHLLIDEHMKVLQQANSKLVIATIEATELAEKLELAKQEIEIAKNLAEKANHAKSEFLSSMSHELRTPLNAILGFAQLLESGSPEPTDSQTKKLNQITKAGWYLLELINQILELAVIESGKLSVSHENISLDEVIRECQIMIEPQSRDHNIQLHILPIDPTLIVVGDKTRLKQVLFNLLSNAIKYNKNLGSVIVMCSESTKGKIRISIKDSGLGLSEEKLNQLFQPFNRLGQEKGLNQGTGIGLMISKELVELMDGTIGVKSTVGIGTEFWVEFNSATPPKTFKLISKSLDSKSQEELITTKYVLLYVEDNLANQMLIEQIIEDHPNLSLLTACDGNMGVALARAHLPDLILLDINLLGISGFETLKILQNDQATANIPVIAISASAMPHDREKALEAGFRSYLSKPIKINEFVKELYKTLKHKT